MQSRSELKRLFSYDDWANREYARALLRLSSPPEPAVRLLGHIMGAQKIWLGRLRGQKDAPAVWPALDPPAWSGTLEELGREWGDYLGSLTDEGLSASISYTNSQGEHWTSQVGDILTHVAFHGAYHRGQLAREIRQAGEAPPPTDYIHAVRRGLVP
jgi:uncharacterized damage-inducible protein DinB